MCVRLYLASGLTLSEIRSMLAEGMAASLLPTPIRDTLLRGLRKGRDAVELVSGACACDLVGRRLADREEDERHLREGFRRRRVPRTEAIQILERHRTPPPGGERARPADFAAFVAEHARNAGPALFLLQPTTVTIPARVFHGETRQLPVREVLAHPGTWLAPDLPTLVLP